MAYMRERWKKYSLQQKELAALVGLILIVGTVFYHYAEGLSVLDSLYFSVTTLTTVGYGDIAPHTAAGKIFTIVYLISGISLMLAFLNLAARRVISRVPLRELFDQDEGARKDDQLGR